MKKTFAFMLGLAVLAGCSKVDSQTEGGNAITGDNGLVPITLGSGLDIISKAAIDNGDAIENAGIAGWEVENATPAFTGNPKWNTTISTTANNTTAQDVTFDTPQYYNAKESVYTHMKAWYPGGILTGTTVSFENTTGNQDVLYGTVSGNKKTGKAGLNFKHMTSQLKFVVKAGDGLAEGTTLKSITVNDAQLPTGFDLTKSDAEVVTYATAAPLPVSGISDQAIETDAADAGDSVMIKPMGNSQLTIDVVTSGATFTNMKVNIDGGNMEAGYAYTITLTFRQEKVDITAKVDEWIESSGSGDII